MPNPMGAQTTLRHLWLSEVVAIGLFIVVAIVAMTRPTPLLTEKAADEMALVYPLRPEAREPFEVPGDSGIVRVKSVNPYGCIEIEGPGRQRVGPICNRHLDCRRGPLPTVPSNLFVFQISGTGQYFAQTGSACDSACCDMSGMRFALDGKRLDDGPFHRVYLRLGLLGCVALGIGAASAMRRRLNASSVGWRIASLLAFMVAVFSLWTEL